METYNFKYRHKSGTKSRYERIEGLLSILPQTLSIDTQDLSPSQNEGIRNILKKTGSFVGEFRKDEISPLKISPIRPRCRGTLFKSNNLKIFGFSDLAFANEKNEWQRGTSLIVFKYPKNGIYDIIIFKGGWENRESILKNL
jgi:hypothetical protein